MVTEIRIPHVLACMLTCTSVLAQEYTFNYEPSFNGQQILQDVRAETIVKTKMTQASQTISESTQSVESKQARLITILEADPRRTAKARITYKSAELSLAKNQHPTQQVDQPVAGKSYHVSRPPNAELIVTNDQGQTPPDGELTIVKASMESIGRSNPLAKFLNGRSVAIGQTLRLPPELAKELLKGGDGVGEINSVILTLTSIQTLEGLRVAVFTTRMSGISPLDGKSQIRFTGETFVDLDSCRTLRTTFQAPVTFSETRGPTGSQFTVHNDGHLNVAIQATYSPRR